MNFKKLMLLGLLTFLINVPFASAAPPENELNQYLAEIGWTKEQLLEHLDFYEIPLDEFTSVEELKEVLGTPINDQNLQALLTTYELTQQELNDLLDHFGDSLNEYKFIEDLDAAVDFYVNHDEYMADIENALNELGITEEETEKFFEYLAQVEEENKFQLDQMEAYDTRLEKFLFVEDTSELSDEELDELAQILTETIGLYQIQVKFKLENKEITLKELLKMKEAPKNLSVTVLSNTGEFLIDFNVPEWFFETGTVIDEGEEMIHLGDLSNEFVDHMHDEKYGARYK